MTIKLRSLIPAPVLIVDDNPDNLKVLAQQVRDAGWKVAIAKDGLTAIEQAQHSPPVLILLDVIMPGLDGFETCRQLKSLPETKDIPIIFMTALNDTANKVKGLSVGGVDYITKPFQGEEVLARINLHCQLSSLNQRLERHNQLLEDKVNERTAELLAALKRLQDSQEQLQRSFEEVTKAKERAESADRAKSEFLRNMSHELLTPLNAIIGYTDLLSLTETDLSVEALEALQSIQNSGEHLVKMIRNILTLSKAEKSYLELDLDTFSVEKLLRKIERDFQSRVQENDNSLDIELKEISTIYSDREKVRQILELILDNACKFTENGRISVTVSQQKDIDSLLIAIEDTGIGISVDQVPRIFLPFIQADGSLQRKYGGAGLGLAVAQNLTQSLGGKITVNTQLGAGSIFTVILPLDSRRNEIAHE